MDESVPSNTRRKPALWRIATLLLTLASGGAAGAFISHYFATRQSIVTYSVNTTSLGAAEATKSVLPDLRLQMGATEIPVVYTHTVGLALDSGPELDQASVSVGLGEARLLGNIVASGPDPVHRISCRKDTESNTVLCTLGRLSGNNGQYKVIIATEQDSKLSVSLDAKNASLRESTEQSRPSPFSGLLFWLVGTLTGWLARDLWNDIQVRRIDEEIERYEAERLAGERLALPVGDHQGEDRKTGGEE